MTGTSEPVPLEDPDPELTDGIVHLRAWRAGDLNCVRRASRDERILEATTVPARFSEEAGRAFIRRQQQRTERGQGWSLAVVDIASRTAIGNVVLLRRPQSGVAGIGYWIVPEARGCGAASRAVGLLATWGTDQAGFARVEAWVEPDNVGSIRVLERCGFVREGRLRSFLTFPDRRADAWVYSRVRGPSGPTAGVPSPS